MAKSSASSLSFDSSTMPTTLSASQLTLKPSLLRCNQTSQFRYPPTRALLLNPRHANNGFSFSPKVQPLAVYRRNSRFCAIAEGSEGNGESSDGADGTERLGRGDSTLPERFRYLTKSVPEPPSMWPWFLALPLLIYSWRAVLFEPSNYKNLAIAILGFFCDLSAVALALIFNFIGDPITFLLRFIETTCYAIQSHYSGIVSYAPVGELCVLITLSSAVIAIAEATVPDSVLSQPYIISGLIGYAAVKGYISGLLFWTLLLGLYGFLRVVKRRDDVSSVMPVAALLAAIGEPWVRVVVMSLYLGLAVSQHWRRVSKGNEEVGAVRRERKVPLPLLAAALAIGVHLAAKWAENRHLTWMAS